MYGILVAKLYDIIYKFNIGIFIKLTLEKLFKFVILLILYIISKSLQYYLMKLVIV